MARRSDHSREELKEMILTAAEKIVVREGYAGLTARKLMKSVGYTVGTLYLVFDNIDALILHLNAKTLDSLYISLNSAFTEHEDVEKRITALGEHYIDFADQHQKLWQLLFEYQRGDDQATPDWDQEKIQRLFLLVEENLRPLKKLPHEERIQAAAVLWSGVHGICILNHSQRLQLSGSGSPKALVQSLISNHLKGLGQ